MYISTKTITALHTSQIAYPVGQDKDSYTIMSWYRENLQTGIITSEHKLVKNWSSDRYKKPDVSYAEGTRFTEDLHTGTYQECVEITKKIVMEQGEWRQIPDKPFEKQLEFTV